MATIAVINKSTLVTDTDMRLATLACDYQMRQHASVVLGRKAWPVVFFAKNQTVPEVDYQIVIMDNADQAGALGYHTEDAQGKPWGRIFAGPVLQYGGSPLRGALSVSAVLSHEVLETYADPNVNYWCDTLQGKLVAYEVCDPVENDAYEVSISQSLLSKSQPVAVSNFVTDEWFDPSSSKSGNRLDYMKRTTAPFKMSPNGYMVVWDSKTGAVSQVFGDHYDQKLATIKHPAHPVSRATRRGK